MTSERPSKNPQEDSVDVTGVGRDIATVHRANQERLDELTKQVDELKSATNEVLAEANAALTESDAVLAREPPKLHTLHDRVPEVTALSVSAPDVASSWSEVVEEAESFLRIRNIEQPRSVVELLSDHENEQITAHLCRPLYNRIPWERWDYIVAFGAGLAGAAVDVLLGTPGKFVQKAMTEESNWLGRWCNSVHHMHSSNAPID